MADKACHDIRKVERYVDSAGREVIVFEPVFGKTKEAPLVKGAAIVAKGRLGPDGKPIVVEKTRIEWAFPDGTSIKKAFEMFDDVAKVEVENFKKMEQDKAKASQVVGARGMNLPTLLGPNGKKMG